MVSFSLFFVHLFPCCTVLLCTAKIKNITKVLFNERMKFCIVWKIILRRFLFGAGKSVDALQHGRRRCTLVQWLQVVFYLLSFYCQSHKCYIHNWSWCFLCRNPAWQSAIFPKFQFLAVLHESKRRQNFQRSLYIISRRTTRPVLVLFRRLNCDSPVNVFGKAWIKLFTFAQIQCSFLFGLVAAF